LSAPAVISPNGPGYSTSLPLKEASQVSQPPLQPSMHLVQIPDIGTTFLDRLNVPVASLAFGLLRFILDTSDYKYADCLAYSLKKNKIYWRSNKHFIRPFYSGSHWQQAVICCIFLR
jgi:hypothetical protein